MQLASVMPTPIAWRRLAPLLLLMAAVLALFRDTVVAMVTIWDRSETFAHAFLVPPIVVWLVWRRRETLAAMPSRPALWTLLPMAAACALWLLGDLAGLNAATQFAVVALLVLAVPAVYGWDIARALTFPLLFLFFCVPFGEFMVPYMMGWTADFAAQAIRWSGVPIYREGLQFVIPTGNWSVVEACSGVRYLIASFMVGTLFAYLNFQSNRKRAVFMVVSLLVPIVANWVRAYLIVMIGHLSGNKLATGVDHIIYGWIFFGLVIGAMFMIGARWADAYVVVPAAAVDGRSARVSRPLALVCALALLLLVGAQAANWQLNRPHTAAPPALALPQAFGAEWTAQAEPLTHWVPAYSNAALSATRSYHAGDAQVGVWLSYYRDQGYDHKMVTSTNNLTDIEAKGDWAQTAADSVSVTLPAGPMGLRAGDLRGSPEPGNPTAQRLRVWQVYWIGGQLVSGDTHARALLALNRLRGRGDDAAVLFFYTPLAPSASGSDAADALLGRFVPAALPALQTLLNQAP